MNYKLKKILVFTLPSLLVALPRISSAEIKPIMDRVPPACKDSGTCSLNDIVQMVVNLSDIIIGVIGSIVLLFFVYGGVVMLTSAGNKERVTQGRRIILGALTGLAIIFFSYAIISYIATTLGVVETDIFKTK